MDEPLPSIGSTEPVTEAVAEPELAGRLQVALAGMNTEQRNTAMGVMFGQDAIREGKARNRIDLGGRTVIPGIIDSHNHIALVANRPGHWVGLEDVFTHEDAVARRMFNGMTPSVCPRSSWGTARRWWGSWG